MISNLLDNAVTGCAELVVEDIVESIPLLSLFSDFQPNECFDGGGSGSHGFLHSGMRGCSD